MTTAEILQQIVSILTTIGLGILQAVPQVLTSVVPLFALAFGGTWLLKLWKSMAEGGARPDDRASSFYDPRNARERAGADFDYQDDEGYREASEKLEEELQEERERESDGDREDRFYDL